MLAVHSAFEIFNGIIQAVREFAEAREPEVIVFATKKENLAKIYETYLRRESGTLAGYELETPSRMAPYVEFGWRRMKPSNWNAANIPS